MRMRRDDELRTIYRKHYLATWDLSPIIVRVGVLEEVEAIAACTCLFIDEDEIAEVWNLLHLFHYLRALSRIRCLAFAKAIHRCHLDDGCLARRLRE